MRSVSAQRAARQREQALGPQQARPDTLPLAPVKPVRCCPLGTGQLPDTLGNSVTRVCCLACLPLAVLALEILLALESKGEGVDSTQAIPAVGSVFCATQT